MSYKLIDANALNGIVTSEDYEKVMNAPCVYADLPNGIDGEHYIAIKATEQKACADAISRKAVLKAIKKWWRTVMDADGNPSLCDDILVLPPVTPTRCIAAVHFSKEDLQEIVNEKVQELIIRGNENDH